MLSRREAITALASAAALPLVTACSSNGTSAAPPPNDGDALEAARRGGRQSSAPPARERHLARHRHRREGGAAIAARRSLRGRAAAPGGAGPRRSRARQGVRTQPACRTPRAPASRSCAAPMRRRSRASRCRTATITVGGWRNTPYVVIQNVGAYLDIPRFLDSDHPHRERRRRRGVSRAAAVVCEAARRRARPHAGGARHRARAAGVPDRQGAGADDALGEERARGRLARRVHRAADEEHPGNWASARTGDRDAGESRRRSSGSWRNCRRSAPSPRTRRACRRGRTARSSTGGRSRHRRRPQCRRTRSTRWARASCSGLHAQMDAILKEIGYSQGSVGERMKALAKDPRYQVLRRRQGPRRDHGLHQESPGLDPRADAARVQHGRRLRTWR